jgi:hypothetical protein
MKFFISFNHVEGEWEKLSDSEREGHTNSLRDFSQALKREKGTNLVFFAPPQHAQTVRIDSGTPLQVLDGPALPGPEASGGYYVIEADSLDEAIEWAKRGRFLVGSNEVRQIIEFQP